MGILDIDLENTSLDDNFDEDHPDTIILIKLLACRNKFKKSKELKKELSEEIIPRDDGIGACKKIRKNK